MTLDINMHMINININMSQFYSGDTAESASKTLIELDLPEISVEDAQKLSNLQFTVKMRGPDGGWIKWVWEVLNQVTKEWVKLGDNTGIPYTKSWTWELLEFGSLLGAASDYLLQTGSKYSVIIRQTCQTLKADAITIDYMRVRFQLQSGGGGGSGSGSSGSGSSTPTPLPDPGDGSGSGSYDTVPTENDVLSRALVVTSSANADSYKGVRMNLWNFGIAFDTVTVPLSPALALTDPATGLPRYSLIVFAAGSDRAALDAYELKYKIRRVVFYSNPSLLSSAASGIGAVTSSPSTADTLVVADPAAVGATAVSNGGGMLFTGSYPSYRASIPASSAFKPFMFFGSTGGQPAAGLVTLGDGRQQMHFFFTITETPFGDWGWHVLSSYVANLWIPWATRGAYVGMRRMYFSAQIDDLGFADSPTKGGAQIRNTPRDFDFMIAMQESIRSAFNADGDSDDFIAEWAYNGGMFCSPKYGDQYYCQGLDPTGAEYKAQLYEDPLFVAAQKTKDKFLWLSHTWSHETMTSLSYSQANDELYKNVEFAKLLFGSDDYKTHSKEGLVPPFMVHILQTVPFTLDGKLTTLYELYVRQTIEKVHRIYTGLPVKTLKQDDIFQIARDHRAREFDCGLDARLRMEDGAWTGILLSSQKSCRVPVTMTGLSAETLSRYAGTVAVEQYGVDRTAEITNVI
eukprot:tig00000076_g2439.t1